MNNYTTHFISLLCAAGITSSALAVPPDALPQQQDLQNLRQRIDMLKDTLKSKEANRSDASDALKASEQAISAANRALVTIEQQRQVSERALVIAQAQLASTRQQVYSTRARVAQVLAQQYRNGSHDALQLLLNQQDPNQVSRDLTYYTYIARAQQAQFNALKEQMAQLETLSAKLQAESDRLAALEEQRAEAKDKLLREQQQHQHLVSQLSNQIQTQRKQLSRLQADEKRLSSLIIKIQREIEARAREAARKQAEAKKRAQEEIQRHQREARAAREAGRPAPPEPKQPVTTVDEVADSGASGKAFASLRGQLKLPTGGQITSQFGSKRGEGSRWKGIFIQAPSGQAVRAVGDGRVVYADWLRGFGNLMIVDHGGNYMSIYGNAESLLKTVGSAVKAGDTIATTGSSGGAAHSGLYFELRHLGQPLNPNSWVK